MPQAWSTTAMLGKGSGRGATGGSLTTGLSGSAYAPCCLDTVEALRDTILSLVTSCAREDLLLIVTLGE